jgi:hypothetical protein
MLREKVRTLSEYIRLVKEFRVHWNRPDGKELWFRGESRKHETILRPQLYRPPTGKSLMPISELLAKECELYGAFQRCAVQLCDESGEGENWEWDSYFLMQHHSGPTRLLDWSDGSLIALHFAVCWNSPDDGEDAFVYVLDPDQLKDQLNDLPEIPIAKKTWKDYVTRNPTDQLSVNEWECLYLPTSEEDIKGKTPCPPLVFEFPHITRRVAAQRSRFILFGTEPDWLADQTKAESAPVKVIVIASSSKRAIRLELRDAGITESVIFPDLDGLGREMKQLWEEWKSRA